MEESLSGRLFINSAQVGDYVEIQMPEDGKKPAEELRIHYLEAGIGEPMLLIHGIGQSLYTWRSVFSELSENYRVIAMDLPGHGYSSRPDVFSFSMDEMALAIKLFLDAKEIRSAHMIGFSTGSMYMLHLLSKYPNYVANCIAISPGDIAKPMPKLICNLKNRATAVFTRNLFSFNDVKKCLQEGFYDQTSLDKRVVDQYYDPISDGVSREILMYAIQNYDMEYVADGLKETDHEVLLLWGREDKWHRPNSSIFFQGILKNGRYFLIRNSGHFVQEDSPDKLLQVVFSYIPTAVPSYAHTKRSVIIPQASVEPDDITENEEISKPDEENSNDQ